MVKTTSLLSRRGTPSGLSLVEASMKAEEAGELEGVSVKHPTKVVYTDQASIFFA